MVPGQRPPVRQGELRSSGSPCPQGGSVSPTGGSSRRRRGREVDVHVGGALTRWRPTSPRSTPATGCSRRPDPGRCARDGRGRPGAARRRPLRGRLLLRHQRGGDGLRRPSSAPTRSARRARSPTTRPTRAGRSASRWRPRPGRCTRPCAPPARSRTSCRTSGSATRCRSRLAQHLAQRGLRVLRRVPVVTSSGAHGARVLQADFARSATSSFWRTSSPTRSATRCSRRGLPARRDDTAGAAEKIGDGTCSRSSGRGPPSTATATGRRGSSSPSRSGSPGVTWTRSSGPGCTRRESRRAGRSAAPGASAERPARTDA